MATLTSRRREKQDRLETIRAKLTAQLKQKLDNEDELIRKAISETEAKLKAETDAKEAAVRGVQADITRHRMEEVRQGRRYCADIAVNECFHTRTAF